MHSKDEKEPYSFIMNDAFYINGLVKEWNIEELDLIHAERDDELMIREKFR